VDNNILCELCVLCGELFVVAFSLNLYKIRMLSFCKDALW
jgi:hypothetical protein